MKTALLYITARNKKEAGAIASALVKERLAACANIVSGVQSIYRWKGTIERAEEVVVFAKTKQSLVAKAISRAKKLHSYECPCIVSFPIDKGNPDFLTWIGNETL